ncbi:hypothetical protein MSG28_006240 [Choristoneura fumiferana]|uniref:Uncharacterized protein n=1 Tax=Choristoneura fumiferana TaxID=7141 RepID=A0ACC0JE40_CHOFU|nr:hypothetical protein MSG28_006240 [Choristoneura fumiferana]
MDALFAIEPLDQFKNIAQEVLNNLYKKNERATLIEHSVVENAQQEIQQLISDSEFNIDKVVASVESNSWDQSINNSVVINGMKDEGRHKRRRRELPARWRAAGGGAVAFDMECLTHLLLIHLDWKSPPHAVVTFNFVENVTFKTERETIELSSTLNHEMGINNKGLFLDTSWALPPLNPPPRPRSTSPATEHANISEQIKY